MNTSSWTPDIEAHLMRQYMSGLVTERTTPQAAVVLEKLCRRSVDKIKSQFRTPQEYATVSAGHFIDILGESIQEERAVNPGIDQALGFSEWEIIQSNFIGQCLERDAKVVHIQPQLETYVCQFNYLKSKCKSPDDWHRLTARDFADARNECVD